LSFKKTALKPWKCPEKDVQQAMIEKIEQIEQKCDDWKAVMLFEDAVHQLHTTQTWYAIQRKGKEYTKVFESNTGRNRYTILWAINPKTYEFIWEMTKETCNMDMMNWLLLKIALAYQEEIEQWKDVYLILDNARYQKAYIVQDYAKELWITLVYLPPYCPHLNLIERLRKRFKKKLKNIYFSAFTWFCEYIDAIFWNLNQSIEELQTLLQLNFWII